jgi:putative (di)nucleoside polyphosphate hydrolase
LQEETNVTSATLLAEAPGWLSYDLPVDIGKEAWKGRWRGQAQKWFAFRLTGNEAEINIAHARRRPQGRVRRLALGPLDETPDLIIPFKQQVYRNVAGCQAASR